MYGGPRYHNKDGGIIMLADIYDMQMEGKKLAFKTKLPKSFLALLIRSLSKDGVIVNNIHDDGGEIIVSTSLCEIRMTGSWSVSDFKRKLRNEYYRFLNERFDKRVELLRSKGYQYYKEYACFAKSEMSARNHNGIPNGVVMHEHDFLFNINLE